MDTMDTTVANLTNRARNAAVSMTDAAGEAVAAIDERRSTAADGLDTAASALNDKADELPGGNGVRRFARATANRLSSSADYVRTHDAKRMMADVETFVKGNRARRSSWPPRSDFFSLEPCLEISGTSQQRGGE